MSSVKVVVNRLPGVPAAVGRALDKAIPALAVAVREKAQIAAPVDTGNLRASIADAYDDKTKTGTVTVGAEYGIYIEKGTVHMAAKPFLAPAAIEVQAVAGAVVSAMIKQEVGNV